MTSQRKIDQINREIGSREINIHISTNNLRLKINDDEYILSNVVNARVENNHHASVDILVGEEESYNFLKGHVLAEWMDHPIGYLGGIETKQQYETIDIKRVELVVYFSNRSKKRYTAGIFISTDSMLDACVEEAEFKCKKILESIDKVNGNCTYFEEDIVIKEKKSPIIELFKTIFKIYLIIQFFPFSLIYLWMKHRKM